MDEPIHWVRDPEAIACLASPVRQRIMDRLEAMGPASAAELAAELGLAPDRLYYHLKVLQGVDLIVPAGTRGEGRRAEARFDLVARRWHLAYAPQDPERCEAIDRLTWAMLRQAQADFESGWEHPAVAVEGPARNQWSLRLEADLGPEDMAALNAHLQGILTLLRRPARGQRREGDTRIALTWALSPLVTNGGLEETAP